MVAGPVDPTHPRGLPRTVGLKLSHPPGLSVGRPHNSNSRMNITRDHGISARDSGCSRDSALSHPTRPYSSLARIGPYR